MAILTVEEMQARVGTETVSDWVTIDQAMIDAFADATGDRQFIHVDPARAAATPFGGTIAHGFLTLSLMPLLASKVPDAPTVAGSVMGVNYGGDRIRFLTPVRAGARVRGRFRLLAFTPQPQPGRYRRVTGFTVEIEGADRPALAAEWIELVVTRP